MEGGVLAGYPVVDVRVTVIDGSYMRSTPRKWPSRLQDQWPSRMRKEGQISLLEPVMNVEDVTPEEYMGDVIGDLNSRRGKIQSMEKRGKTR